MRGKRVRHMNFDSDAAQFYCRMHVKGYEHVNIASQGVWQVISETASRAHSDTGVMGASSLYYTSSLSLSGVTT